MMARKEVRTSNRMRMFKKWNRKDRLKRLEHSYGRADRKKAALI